VGIKPLASVIVGFASKHYHSPKVSAQPSINIRYINGLNRLSLSPLFQSFLSSSSTCELETRQLSLYRVP
jgi:hypothetical protein